jgi:O-antigen/teichoic acid export membrane protein
MMTDQTKQNGFFRQAGFLKSVQSYLPATIIYRALNLSRGIILTWLLARETGQLGLISFALQAINIIAPLASLGLNEAITRYIPAWQQQKTLPKFLKYALYLILGLSASVCFILILFHRPIGTLIFSDGNQTQNYALLTIASFVTMFLLISYFFVISILKALRMYPALAWMELFHGVLIILFSLIFVLLIGRKAEWVIWSYAAALLIPTLIWGYRLIRHIHRTEPSEEHAHFSSTAAQLIRFGFWAASSGAIWQLWQTYSLWYLIKFESAHLSDVFATARLIGQIIFILGVALASVVMANVCVQWEKGNRAQSNMIFDLYSKIILIGLLFLGLLMVQTRELVAMIFPRQLSSICGILPETILYYHLCVVLTILSIQIQMVEKMRLMMPAWLVTFGANVLLVWWMLKPNHALEGAALATALSAVPGIIVMMIFILIVKQPLSAGLVISSILSFLLMIPSWLAWVIFSSVLVVAISGSIIFSSKQKAVIRENFHLLWKTSKG